ncbi:FYN-binding protein 1 isoform X2 [Catharus ustulatus]|uniref:FYN-binding protein 1 isoform X2 n=1 Tax=Catharus ustulatus TaxID=91951 RepID=UPI00140B73E4|nr:FYN-binding protein 1 isoform X2 [Catharus ustulatus]
MEKYEISDRDTEDPSTSRPTKVPRRDIPTGLQTRKAALEKLAKKGNVECSSGPSTLHKPVQPKPPLSVKPSSDDKTEKDQPKPPLSVKPSSDDKTEKDPNPPRLSLVAQRFGAQFQPTNRGNDEKTGCTKFSIKTSDPSKEDPKPLNLKPAWNKFNAPRDKEKNLGPKPNLNFASQENEAKPVFLKAAEETVRPATQANEPKPLASKPPLAQKPSLISEVSQSEDTSNKSVSVQAQRRPRTNIHVRHEVTKMGESSNSAAEAAGSHFPKSVQKHSGCRSSLSKEAPKTVAEGTEEKRVSAARSFFQDKILQEESRPSHTFHKMNTALAGRPPAASQEKGDGDKSSRMPKRQILPPVFKLGQPPKKPSRPPRLQLGPFRQSCQEKDSKKGGLIKKAPSSAALAPLITPSHSAVQLPPPPPSSHPSLQVPAVPSLPPRNIKPRCETIDIDNEENYDDVEFVSSGHGNTQRGQESDGEMYEDINDIRSSREKEKKQGKEDKRRMDQEKKEQKEKEKKEYDLRKKFKLTGPIEVLHQARVCVDYKGGKNELTVKQGDKIEIIRLTDNPEGKWLGRIKGRYGYIKTTMVEIDYDSLKRKQKPSAIAAAKHTDSDQEMYDDVGEQDTTSSQSGDQGGSGNMFPPPPSDQDIYDGIDDEDATASTSSTKQSGKDYGEDVYDDIDASDFPPPPSNPSSSKLGSFGKPNSDEKDAQKLKMEKEEKEFRKKFKFDGEIKVLYSATTVQDLSQQKWGYKDLQIKPGESLDIIESTDDTKVLCRNKEGKYGYVLRSNLVQNDGDIYDDISDDSIYDNESDADMLKEQLH